MRPSAFLVPLALLLAGHAPTTGPEADREEALKAAELLNRIRKQPTAYCQRLKFSPVQVAQRPALVWNDTLARVAERKAKDMARRNYLAHVDPEGYGMNHHIAQAGYRLDPGWLTDPRMNNFESIQAGCLSGEEAIECLIVDHGVPTKGHRTHLLGVGEWNASLVDIGIGFVRYDGPSEYTTYTCVLIAKHR